LLLESLLSDKSQLPTESGLSGQPSTALLFSAELLNFDRAEMLSLSFAVKRIGSCIESSLCPVYLCDSPTERIGFSLTRLGAPK